MSTQRSHGIHPSLAAEPGAAAVQKPKQRARRLKPEVAARLLERRREEQLRDLYRKPVEALSEEELELMRAAFLRGT